MFKKADVFFFPRGPHLPSAKAHCFGGVSMESPDDLLAPLELDLLDLTGWPDFVPCWK